MNEFNTINLGDVRSDIFGGVNVTVIALPTGVTFDTKGQPHSVVQGPS